MAASSSRHRLADVARETYAIDPAEVERFVEANREHLEAAQPKVPPGTAYHRAIAESQLKGVFEGWLPVEKKKAQTHFTDITSYEDFLHSNVHLPEWFWNTLCEMLAKPYQRKEYATLDEDGNPTPKAEAFSVITVRNRVEAILIRHNQLRPHAAVGKSVKIYCSNYIMRNLTDKYGLKPPKQKHVALYGDVLCFMEEAILGPQMHGKWKMPREPIQMAGIVSFLFFTAVRPGDVLIPEGYQKQNDALKWGDVQLQYFHDGEEWRLRSDVKIRNFKCHKTDPEHERIVPLYENGSLPTICDTTRLLFLMAIEDGALSEIDNVEELASYDLSRVPLNTMRERVIDLPIKESAKDVNIFRAFERENGVGFIHHESRGWTCDAARHLLQRLAPYAGLEDLSFMTLRYSGATTLHRSSVKESEAKRALGHSVRSEVMYKHYLSSHAVVDLLGLQINGIENKAAAQHTGIRGSPYIELTRAQKLQIENDPEVQNHQRTIDNLRDGLVARYGTMAAAERSGDAKWFHYRKVHYQLSQLRKQKEKDLRATLKEQQKVNRVKKLFKKISKPDASLQWKVTGKMQIANDSGFGLDESAQDGAIANAPDDDSDEGSDIMDLGDFDPFELSKDTSEEDLASEEELMAAIEEESLFGSDDEYIDDTVVESEQSAPHNAQTGATSEESLPSPIADLVASATKEMERTPDHELEAIYARHHQNADGNKLLLAIGAEKPSIVEAAKELSKPSRYSIKPHIPDDCPTCGKSLTRKHGNEHMLSCEETTTLKKIQTDIYSFWKGKPCPVAKCKSKLDHKSLINITGHILLHDRKSDICGFAHADGTECQFPLQSIDVSTEANALLRVHRQIVHGWYGSHAHLVDRFGSNEPLLIGAVNIESRAEEHFLDLASKRRAVDVHHQCGICLGDSNLSPSQQMHDFKSGTAVANHVVVCHILPTRSNFVRCLQCNVAVHTHHWIEHLNGHGYKLGAQKRAPKTLAELDSGFTLKPHKVTAYLDFLSTLAPPDEGSISNIDDAEIGSTARQTKREIRYGQTAPRKKLKTE